MDCRVCGEAGTGDECPRCYDAEMVLLRARYAENAPNPHPSAAEIRLLRLIRHAEEIGAAAEIDDLRWALWGRR
jgi:hypothetical protein